MVFGVDRSLNYGRPVMRRFLRRAAPFGAVLDIGAGHGDDLQLARELAPDCRLVGVECHPPYQRDLRAAGVEVVDLNLEQDRLPFEDASFDVVSMNQILEHLKEIFWITHEVSRVLRPGGHFILGLPNLAAAHNRLLLLFGLQPTQLKNNSAHVRGFTRHDVERYFETVCPGLYSLREFAGANFYPFAPPLARPLARWLPGLAFSSFYLWHKEREYAGEILDFPLREELETNFFLGAEGKNWRNGEDE